MGMRTGILSLLFCLMQAHPALAEAPQLQNSGPIIHLAENLDEPENLGWCLDTVGRGQSDQAHLHSCKPDSDDPRNRDVLFQFNAETGSIEHGQYQGLCLTIVGASLALIECIGAQDQKFSFGEDGTFHPFEHEEQCLSAGDTSRAAGPYMSRSLIVAPCAEVDPDLRTWVIKPAD